MMESHVLLSKTTSRVSSDFQAKTFVDQVVDALLKRALQGIILPGERLYEADLSRDLGISRAPIREALRILEGQGVIESIPYRGTRLAPLSSERIRHINLVRFELERLALGAALSSVKRSMIHDLEGNVKAMSMAADHDERLTLAKLDTEFHGIICSHGGNPVIGAMWAILRPQLLIVFGVSMFAKDPSDLVKEHVSLLTAIGDKSAEKAIEVLRGHILRDNMEIDFEVLVQQRRAEANRLSDAQHMPNSPSHLVSRRPRGRPRRVQSPVE